MRTFRDAKVMARTLRAEALERRKVEFTHSECLEIVARQFGFDDWNILAARIARSGDQPDDESAETDGGPCLTGTMPILRIFSVEKAMEFYVDWLGFNLDWEHRFEAGLPLYAQVSRSGVTLHLSEHHGDAIPGSTVFIEMSGIRDLHRELSEKEYAYANPGVEEVPWGWELCVTDPFGNRLRFCEKKPEPGR